MRNRRVFGLAVIGLVGASLGAAAQKDPDWIVTVAPLKFDKGTVKIGPWGPVKPGDAFTALGIDGGPAKARLTVTKAVKSPGHCFAPVYYSVTLKAERPDIARRIKPAGKHADGSPRWPTALFVTPAAPKAKLLPASKMSALALPDNHIHANLIAAADLTGDGEADALLVRSCHYIPGVAADGKPGARDDPKVPYTQCRAMKGTVFHRIYIRRDGAWKTMEYGDLC
jgi:hypothetical protein